MVNTIEVDVDFGDFELTDRDVSGANGGPLSEFEGTDVDPLAALDQTAQGKLKSLVERLERLKEDRDAVNADMKEVFGEAKGEGFDTAIVRKVLKIRAMDKAKREEEEALTDIYLAALGEWVSE